MAHEIESRSPEQVADILRGDGPGFAQVFMLCALKHEQSGEFFEALANYNIARPLTWRYRALIDERIAEIRQFVLPPCG